MKNTRHSLVAFALAPLLMVAAPGDVAGQSSTAVSPFVSYVPSAAQNPMAGFALTFGGTTGLAFRAGGDLSIETPQRMDTNGTVLGEFRPWSADADAMLFLGGIGGGATVFRRALNPYLFTGIGMMGGDSAGTNAVRTGWSYGAGASLPLGWHADIFAEARFRMPAYVLPTAKNAPDSKSEFRFGLSFLVGGEPERPRRGRRYAEREDDRPVAPAPAPQPQVVVVQQPAPQPAPQPVVVVQQPAPPPTVVVVEPEPRPRVNVNFPIIIGGRSRDRHDHDRGSDRVVIVRPNQPTRTNPVWVPTVPVNRTKQRDPQPSMSCTTSKDRRTGEDAKVCVVKP